MNIKHSGRISVQNDENFEPGSNHQVLKNYLGIKSKNNVETLEEQELERTEADRVNPCERRTLTPKQGEGKTFS